MDKNAIKKYATWARRELIKRVSQKAEFYGVTQDGYGDYYADSIDGRVLTHTEKSQRQALIRKVQYEGFEQAMEEVAYTWFNRFSALRYMEVNNYLPTRVRVFTDEAGEFKPQIIDEAIHLELDGLDMERVYAYKEADDTEALYRYLLITQCNALSKIMPVMFQKISDYTELLLPDYLLREESVIEQMVVSIPEEDWRDQVQIIGWLYQYYNAEKKDEVFAALKKNVKITKENIPAATQLFTPDWIVRYMVENSLGRLWVEGHPNDELKAGWKYYLEEAEQEPEVEAQLAEIRKEYAVIKPEDILCVDPCAGSGHILDYLFDVLVQIYTDYGYTTQEAVKSIIENNLYGLDIDERAAQLAYFSVMMKARSYDRRFLTRKDEDGNPEIPQPHVYAIVESNELSQEEIDYFTNGNEKLENDFGILVEELRDAKEYGSILNITQVDFAALYARVDEVKDDISMYKEAVLSKVPQLIRVAEALAQKYHVVVTNPPYMGSSNMGTKLSNYVKKNYSDSKGDVSTVCMERTIQMCTLNGYMTMINIPVWMFLSSYEKLRIHLLQSNTLVNMVHPGRGIFGSDFGTTTFVFKKGLVANYKSSYRRLFEQQGEVKSPDERENVMLAGKGQYTAQQSNFFKIPGSPVAYWVSENFIGAFNKGTCVGSKFRVSEGIKTGDNDKFLRFWTEIDETKFSFANVSEGKKWYPHHKGGDYRRWYGNLWWVINWENNGADIKNSGNSGLQGKDMYFKTNIGWSKISAKDNPVRYYSKNVLFDSMAPSIYGTEHMLYLTGLLNSCVAYAYLHILNPTLALQVGDMRNMPIIYGQEDKVENIVDNCIFISKSDWDAFEISWEYITHPLVALRANYEEPEVTLYVDDLYEGSIPVEYSKLSPLIAQAFDAWERLCDYRFTQLKVNEEELNRIFIDIYGLQDELTPEVEDKDVTVRLADKSRDIRSFISYAVGCMFGRYSLDVEGLAYAGGDWDDSKYTSFIPDKDGILPICDDEYFEDDIVNCFVDFVRVVYGEETLEENLDFIASALGGTGSSRRVIRNYFLNDFYNDHCKIYQKRPIYWLFDSGRKNGFKCLIYIHRYKPDTIARICTDYVHEQQSRYRTVIAGLENQIANASTSDRVKLNKQLKKFQDQYDELHGYEEKIHHLADQFISIDLDDGVKHNYEIFKDVLAKIK